MLLQEAHLQFIPVPLVAHDPIVLELAVERGSDTEEIRTAEVVEIGIAEDLGKPVMGLLWHFGGHDHLADAFDLGLGVTELREGLTREHATAFLMFHVLDEEARIVVEGGGAEQVQILPFDVFRHGDGNGRAVHVERMVEAMVGALRRKPVAELREDVYLSGRLVHALKNAGKINGGTLVPVILLGDMQRSATRTPLLLFCLVAVYIVLQSGWWAWLLLSKDRDLLALQQQLLTEGVVPHLPIHTPEHTLWMVVGEGGVFVLLLLLALWLTFRTVRHELTLARQQRDFLLAASHELRTPIAGLKLHLQTLQRHDLDDRKREELATNARTEVARLHTLTEKILLATRLDETHVPLNKARLDASAALRTLCANAEATFARQHHLHCIVPEQAEITTDPDAFRSVAENLLENACKYAPAGTTVDIELIISDGRMELRVSDEGPGVPEEERQRIFQKFVRGGSEETRGTKGTGLGLYIVQRLMHALGGRIEHRPRSPHGSIFAATFPVH